ncbi:hypothetical protein BKA70DRAFT_1395344 [Coprinopsis sp. MPI-PUGE-AT-0042]|nr:hypothetical protein BKA70DRAFT_1395344 [Coprinopsis sp. MPI-PUGE-AT-0042]
MSSSAQQVGAGLGDGATQLASSRVIVSRENIDTRVYALRTEIKRLLAMRNDLSPIFRLPPELLVSIFSEIIAIIGLHEWPRRKVPSWMAVTHVCQQWRTVALDASTLWTDISFDWSRSWLEAMLHRSKQAKLNIVLPFDHKKLDKTIGVVTQSLADITRLRSLKSLGSFVHVIKRLVFQAPHLEKLVLQDYSNAHTLPPHFLASNAPKLKFLELLNWSLASWPSPLLTVLDHFDLELKVEHSGTPSATELLDVLTSMPTLSRLRLSGSQIPSIDEENNRTVQLPRLKSLTVSAVSVNTCTTLLNALRTPLVTQVVIACDVANEDSAQEIRKLGAAFILSCLSYPSASTSPPTFKYISVKSGWSTDLTVSLEHPSTLSRPDGAYQLRLCPRGTSNVAAKSIQYLLDSLPLHEVCRFDLSGASTCSPLNITPLLKLPRIETIHVTGTEAANLLLEHAGLEERFGLSSIRFPVLKNLSFLGVDFKHDRRRSGAIKPSKLTSILSARKEMGVEIHRLRLSSCPMYKKDKDKFKPQCRVFEVSDGDRED